MKADSFKGNVGHGSGEVDEVGVYPFNKLSTCQAYLPTPALVFQYSCFVELGGTELVY